MYFRPLLSHILYLDWFIYPLRIWQKTWSGSLILYSVITCYWSDLNLFTDWSSVVMVFSHWSQLSAAIPTPSTTVFCNIICASYTITDIFATYQTALGTLIQYATTIRPAGISLLRNIAITCCHFRLFIWF